MTGFDSSCYWLLDDLLMAGPWPDRALRDELEGQGVQILVNLTEESYDDPRFDVRQLPVGDYMAPELEQIEELCALVDAAERAAQAVYVHCVAGCGRTGTMMACILVYRERLGAGEAIRRVRDLRECSIESDGQEEVVGLWREHLEENGYRLMT